MFMILLVFFTCLRFGIKGGLEINANPQQRNLLAVQDSSNEGSTLNYSSANAYGSSEEETTPEEEEVPEQAATCKSQFDGTIGIVLFLFGVLYCFVGLAIVCEGEFKDSVVEIARFLKLPPDVAGATLMAAGTSSPELFTSLIAIAGPVADIGTGTIVGSAIFNILIIIGGCVLFSSHTFHLNWKPILRDSIVNLLSFIFLFAIFWDQTIYWYEAFLGCFFYVLYVAMMGVNTQILNCFDYTARKALQYMPFLSICSRPESNEPDKASGKFSHLTEEDQGTNSLLEDLEMELSPLDESKDVMDLKEFNDDDEDDQPPRQSIQEDVDFDTPEEKHEHFPTSIIGWIWYVLAWPYEILFYYTIPPVNGKYKYQFFASFFLSLTWLGIFSTFMVKWTEKIGCILGVEDAIMGVTFLAIGTSMPDCLTSIFVARTGRGNMAVCNALGSNIFDILLALSLPWALSIIVTRSPVAVSSETLVQDVIILTGTLSIFFITLCVNRWRLDKKIGVFFYFLYVVFVTYTVCRELGLF